MNNLNEVADLITAKAVLTTDEASRYLGFSKSYLYKLTMERRIPHYKPLGKMVYFDRLELEAWLHSNRVATTTELDRKAEAAYCRKGGGAK